MNPLLLIELQGKRMNTDNSGEDRRKLALGRFSKLSVMLHTSTDLRLSLIMMGPSSLYMTNVRSNL